ncbi:MAG: DUF3990 domain-containing protein [Spirochaetaceae bacterium]|nr:DUF3990 domain-containing protein [Spirochaetaceae bacterium]MBR4823855.1 DUF3990 domain-containing protein [Spirochaetaceae bacterium]
MKLYHSSTVIVDKPLVSFGRDNLDFGKGFYATNMKLQAEKWIQRFIMLGKNCYVNIYDYNDVEAKSNYKYKNFPEYNEEWLDFILDCRSGSKIFQNYDIIEGGIANDKVFNTVELFFQHLIDKQTALTRLKYEKPNNQICFINQKVLDAVLHFESFYELKGNNQ